MSSAQAIAVWAVSACAVAGILLRPWRVPEWVWAVAGGAAAVLVAAMPIGTIATSIGRGGDVYAFLIGIMLLAELGRFERVFDWVALRLLERARGSATVLLALVYTAGVAVTALLSNDTTIVVLTPAVIAALRRTRLPPLPYLYACAFVANAASFVLPISNPANLVVFGRSMPALAPWLERFGIASVATVALTFASLWALSRRDLVQRFTFEDHEPPVGTSTVAASVILLAAAAVLVLAASLHWNVGWAALACGAFSLLAMAVLKRATAGDMLRHTQWSIVPLVAGLFVLVAALDRSGAVDSIRLLLGRADLLGAIGRLYAGVIMTLASNLFNNLPVGLAAGVALSGAHVASQTASAALVGVDLGPNLSVSGSLATLLWLTVLRRDGIEITALAFLRLGVFVVTPALIAALLLVR